MDKLIRQVMMAGLPAPSHHGKNEYRFELVPVVLTPKTRKPKSGRFDLAWEPLRFAVEVEGVVAPGRRGDAKSRHTTLSGYRDDVRKYNAAALLGWTVLRFTQDQVDSEEARHVIALWFLKFGTEITYDADDILPALGAAAAGGHPLDPGGAL